jgi:hypothetical protein
LKLQRGEINFTALLFDFRRKNLTHPLRSDNIRIFGIVIQKHCAAVTPASDFTSLFLEVPANVESSSPFRDSRLPEDTPLEYALELEMKLREMIGADMYVCMALGEHEWSTPDTCEINFPSHELAMMAKEKIEGSLKMDERFKPVEAAAAYKFNWVKTGMDAIYHWRREVSIG